MYVLFPLITGQQVKRVKPMKFRGRGREKMLRCKYDDKSIDHKNLENIVEKID